MKPVSYVTVWLSFVFAGAYLAVAVGIVVFDRDDAHHAAHLLFTATIFAALGALGIRIRLQQYDTEEPNRSDAPLVTARPEGGWLVHFNGSELDRLGPDYVTLTDGPRHDHEDDDPEGGSPQA